MWANAQRDGNPAKSDESNRTQGWAYSKRTNKMQEIVDKEIDDSLEMGVIKRSEAPYAWPLVPVKKPYNTYRVCVNFKELNKIKVFDPEPMMSPDDIFPKLAGSKIYSSFDFCKGYYRIPMQEESKDYTAFVCWRSLMRFKVMHLGMVNSGSTYNRMIRKLLDGSHNLESYVDDVLGHTENWSKHMEILQDFFLKEWEKVISVLDPANAKLDLTMSNFWVTHCKESV